MGGKSKQAQRTKNNAKPSSSSRSAELLGVPTFVGFSAHSDLGLVPFAPGFATAGHMPDTFDASINPQFQLTMRKMSKKDPMTKKKALQEFIDMVQASDIETIKSILPLWPKFYHNLAADTEHNVRELAQTALQLLVSKCKRAIAPYLKQLVPVWLVSHYDNYAPAASIASASFRETFAGNANRMQEVCLHCQTEIVEYVMRNITFHTAATLSSGKSLAPEEAEQKYQRTIVCSLRALSFFVEHTKGADLTQVHASIQSLLEHQKFWSFAKNKLPTIKAAWFELIYNLLQHPSLVNVVLQAKAQVIAVCFQNIDESDPVVAPQVWGCILLVQSNYDDWYSGLCFKKSVLPKISSLLRNNFNHNAQAICPNLLPFFSKLTPECLADCNWHEFCLQFFGDFKGAVCAQSSGGVALSKAECSVITKSFFECLRFLLQKQNNAAGSGVGPLAEEEAFAMRLLEENVLELAEWSMNSDSVAVKYIYQHIAALAAFWTERQQSGNSSLYAKLLDAFWKRIFQLITKGIEKREYMERILELVQSLHSANPSLEDQRVKFAETDADATDKCDASPRQANERKTASSESTAAFIQKELKQLVVQLVRLCLDNVEKGSSAKCMQSVRRLTKMFPDSDFYACITDSCNLLETLKLFVGLIGTVDEEACEVVVDIVFEILQFLEKPQRFAFINAHLLPLPQVHAQSLVLQRLLSYPLCVEPEMQTLLSGPEASTIIVNVARNIFADNSQEQLNLLHKCFFQTDAGEILIATPTVDALLGIVSEPLDAAELGEMADACGSFIAQIMPVICSNGNASEAMQREIFLKLFKFSMERTVNEFISQDTLWEITTCWEDALSSEDIIIDESLLHMCADIVRRRLEADDLPASAINGMADSMAKFIIFSTENIEVEHERWQKIDATMLGFWSSDDKTTQAVRKMAQHCLFLEALQSAVSTDVELCDSSMPIVELQSIFRQTLLKFCTISKLVCKTDETQKCAGGEGADDEVTDDYCDPNENLLNHWSDALYAEILHCIHIAGVGDSLVNNTAAIDANVETLILELAEVVVSFMSNECKIVDNVKERLLQESAKETDIMPCRSLTFLLHYQQYAQFEENATILLAEDLSEYFIGQNSLKAYVNSLQYLLPKLEPKSITAQSAIMRTEPGAMWIKCAVFRCLVNNNFSAEYNEKSDKNIIESVLQFVTAVAEKQHGQKDLLLHNVEIQSQKFAAVVDVVEYINLLATVLDKFPYELTIKNWDAIRIGLSAWVLSVSKSIEAYSNPKAALFIASVFRLFAALAKFIIEEKQKSSTELLKNMIDEWESLFVREVTLVLFKSFHSLSNAEDSDTVENVECYMAILEQITPAIELLDYGIVYNFCKASTQITLDNVCNFLLKNLSNPIHSMRITCVYILRQLTRFFVADDIETFEQKSETLEGQSQIAKWHYLNRFEDYLARYDFPIQKYLKEFSFKITEIGDLEPIERNEALSYLLLWDCIIYACANSPVSLRSVYTSWLNENKYEENLLHFLFRAMPVEILKNHDSKIMSSDIYRGLTWTQITERNLSLEKYACHLYAEVLRKLPAVVRKWWNTSPSRQKAFVNKLTTNFVSPLICTEELKSIGNKKEKHENMQVTVHTSTREVLAVYSIDEARMELVITLAPNYPLGAVKVECGKQIGGRSTSRNVGMQLTIFLTHQNGTIFDGLTLWKNNLDKKFEGVEECYVCYTVIHQDTCQLPKLTCKTCKKKFHGPCLYKWFTTSSKSTCPICRNVF